MTLGREAWEIPGHPQRRWKSVLTVAPRKGARMPAPAAAAGWLWWPGRRGAGGDSHHGDLRSPARNDIDTPSAHRTVPLVLWLEKMG